MKSIFSLVIILSCMFSVKAQSILEITNSTACSLNVQTYSVSIGGCVYGNYQDNLMGPGDGISINAPSGEEWIYAEITSYPYCSGGVAIAVGTPVTCSSTCSWSASSNITQMNNGCNGCKKNVNATWADPCGHPGVLHITNF